MIEDRPFPNPRGAEHVQLIPKRAVCAEGSERDTEEAGHAGEAENRFHGSAGKHGARLPSSARARTTSGVISAATRHPLEPDWAAWVPRERAVLCFIVCGGRVLLIHKKRGLGAGKVNAPGGKIEP